MSLCVWWQLGEAGVRGVGGGGGACEGSGGRGWGT